MRVIDTGFRRPVRGLAFTADGTRLAVELDGGPVVVHDLAGRADPVPLADRYFRPRLARAGARLLANTHDGMAAFDPATGERQELLPVERRGLALAQDAGGAADGSRLVTHETGANFQTPLRLVGWVAGAGGWERAWSVEQGYAVGFDFAAGGDRFAYVGKRAGQWLQFDMVIRSAATGEVLATGVYDASTPCPPRVRPDGSQVAAAVEMNLLVWDARRGGTPVAVRNDTRRHFTAAAYHPGGRHLFTTSNDATVTAWDTTEWVRVRRFDWEIGRLRAVAVSPDGQLAAAGSDRGTVVVWDVDL